MNLGRLQESGISLPDGFCVGYGRAIVNPANGTSLAGYGIVNARERLSTAILDDLKLTCTAFSDGEEVVLIYSVDSCHVAECIANPLFQMLEERFGIPEKNILFNAIHTHAAPVLYSSAWPGIRKYLDEDSLKSAPETSIILSSPITCSHNIVFPILEGPMIEVKHPAVLNACFNLSSYDIPVFS